MYIVTQLEPSMEHYGDTKLYPQNAVSHSDFDPLNESVFMLIMLIVAATFESMVRRIGKGAPLSMLCKLGSPRVTVTSFITVSVCSWLFSSKV